jgi:hypothetical protein
MFESVVRVRGQLGELVSALDPDAVSGPTAGELWAEFDRIERLGSAAKTLLVRRIAATHDRDRAGSRTAAESLARQAGTSTAAAKEALDTSNRLTELPSVVGALRRGELSLRRPRPSPAPPKPTRRRKAGCSSWHRGHRWPSCGRNALGSRPPPTPTRMPPTGASTPSGAAGSTPTPKVAGTCPPAAPPKTAPPSPPC